MGALAEAFIDWSVDAGVVEEDYLVCEVPLGFGGVSFYK